MEMEKVVGWSDGRMGGMSKGWWNWRSGRSGRIGRIGEAVGSDGEGSEPCEIDSRSLIEKAFALHRQGVWSFRCGCIRTDVKLEESSFGRMILSEVKPHCGQIKIRKEKDRRSGRIVVAES